MEDIARAYLEKGDVASALPVLSTLALGGVANTSEQRRRRLLHARIHREANAVQHCLSGASLSSARRSAVCDALLDDDLPAPVFFGPGAGVEATRRLKALRLAVHPDKCDAPNAAQATVALHERKEAHDANVIAKDAKQADDAEAILRQAEAEAQERESRGNRAQASSPTPDVLPANVPPSHGRPPMKRAPLAASSPVSASPGGASGSPVHGGVERHRWGPSDRASFPAAGDRMTGLASTTRARRVPSASARRAPECSSPLSRTAPARGRQSQLDALLHGARSQMSVSLQSDLSFESCAPPSNDETPEPPTPSQQLPSDEVAPDARLNRVVHNNVKSEFERVRAALLSQLGSPEEQPVQFASSAAESQLDSAVRTALEETLRESYSGGAGSAAPAKPGRATVRTTVSVRSSHVASPKLPGLPSRPRRS